LRTSSEPIHAIEVRGVSKRYALGERRGASGTLVETLADLTGRIRRGAPSTVPREIWSLRDIDVDIAAGDTLGVIGRNGAGKSTLLKVIARITEPTSGVSRTRGRVGALLEVGTGFHPELTGRENVYLNGAILGMRRQEVGAKLEEIVEFAGVAPFMETPVKRFSSGMYLRLAFAIAACLDADILVVDEVLAVGDTEFQRRCLGRMESMRNEGRTVVFVSHDLDAVTRLCSRALWLDGGAMKRLGPADDVVSAYLASGRTFAARQVFAEDPTRPVSVLSVAVLDDAGTPTEALDRDTPLTFEVRFVVRERVPGLDMTVLVHNLRGVRVLDEAWSDSAPAAKREALGEYVARIVVPPILAAGEYVAGVWLGTPFESIFYEDDLLRFRLHGDANGRPNRITQLALPWDVRRVAPVALAKGG
jgi:ABC-type polysaccharide/polyol phosphate transport system ATPase subunit